MRFCQINELDVVVVHPTCDHERVCLGLAEAHAYCMRCSLELRGDAGPFPILQTLLNTSEHTMP